MLFFLDGFTFRRAACFELKLRDIELSIFQAQFNKYYLSNIDSVLAFMAIFAQVQDGGTLEMA